MNSWPPNGSISLGSIATALATRYPLHSGVHAERSNSMLWWAIERNEIAAIGLILSYPDFKVNLYNRHGETPIIHAASRGRTSILRLLLREFEASVNAKDSYGNTPLA